MWIFILVSPLLWTLVQAESLRFNFQMILWKIQNDWSTWDRKREIPNALLLLPLDSHLFRFSSSCPSWPTIHFTLHQFNFNNKNLFCIWPSGIVYHFPTDFLPPGWKSGPETFASLELVSMEPPVGSQLLRSHPHQLSHLPAISGLLLLPRCRESDGQRKPLF